MPATRSSVKGMAAGGPLDDARFLQRFDALLRKPHAPAPYLVVVLAQRGPEAVDAAGRVGEARYDVRHRVLADARVVEEIDVLARLVLRVLEDLVDRVDAAARHLVRLAGIDDLVARVPAGPGAHVGVDFFARGLALLDRAPLARAAELGNFHRDGEALEDLVAGAGDRDPVPVGRRVVAVRHDVHGAGAHALANVAFHVIRGRD